MNKLVKLFCLFVFILSAFLLITQRVETTKAAEVYPFNGIITADALVVHDVPSTSKGEVTQIAYGSRVIITGSASNNMYSVKYDGNQTGYISKSYVINVDNNTLTSDAPGVESYQSYCSTLVGKGFDDSYCPYLYYLHSIHPSWVFNADRVGMTLEEASKGEENYCSLQTTNQNYWLKTTPNECPTKGTCWYYIKSSVIASFMDPRNSLFENLIFQFLDSDANKDLANDSTIEYLVGNGNLKQYLSYFKSAASTEGINVVDLVARSKQEGNNTAGYGPSSGIYTTKTGIKYDGKSLDGYYNFYNIGAYKANGMSPTTRAVAYAAGFFESTSYGRPWDTEEKAITGGANFIASRYVKIGQDTIYYQKFNISSYRASDNKMYTNQYMTNVYAPASEGKDAKSVYDKSGALDSAFVFTIPVFNNMGPVAQPLNKSSVNSLIDITINGTTITGFDPDVVEYNINYPTEENYISLSALPANSSSSVISGTGTLTFVDDVINTTIVVRAEDGSTKSYNLTIKKINANEVVSVEDVINKVDVKANKDIVYGISPNTQVSTLVNSITKNGGNAIVYDAEGNKKNSGSLITGDKIKISGTTEEKNFTVAISGDINSDGKINSLDLLIVQKHILKYNTLSGADYYAADVSYDGKLNSLDLLKIQKHILGYSSL